MGKIKKAAVKPAKVSLVSSIVKRKSMKQSAVLTTKLRLSLAQAKAEGTAKKSSAFNVSDLSSESENGAEVVTPSIQIKSPRHFLAPPKSPINTKQVEEGLTALFEYIQKNHDKNSELFDDEQPIFLQITSVKVPKTPNRQIRFSLKNTLLSESSEICLIVKDEGKAKDHEGTIEHYEELLKDKDITNVKTIMPYHQFKTEYGNQYELVRKLLGLYDYFLVDGRVNGYVTHRLGKIFLEKRKMPASVKMNASNLKEHFETCLNKTLMKLHAKGDCYIVQVGHTKMSEPEVLQNISHIIDQLEREFPGGLDNIRSFGLKTDKSITVPVYLTLKNKSEVNVPVILAKRPKLFEKVTGELTTFLDRDVTVLPTGDIIVSKQGLEDDSDDEELVALDYEEDGVVEDEQHSSGGSDEEDVKEDTDEIIEQSEEEGVVADEDQDEEGGILDQAEEVYLNQYHQQEHVTKRNAKKAKEAIVEDDEIPVKKSKRAIKVQKENIVPPVQPAASKKKAVDQPVEILNTRTRGLRAKPEVIVPVEEAKKLTKKTSNKKKITKLKSAEKEVIPEPKSKKQKASTKTNQTEPEIKPKQKASTKNDDPVQIITGTKSKSKKQKGSAKTIQSEDPVQEILETKTKKNKQKGSTKPIENGDAPVEPKTGRKKRATTVEEAVPAKKTKAIKTTTEEEKPAKTKGKSKPAVAGAVDKKSKKPATEAQNEKPKNKKIIKPTLKVKVVKK